MQTAGLPVQPEEPLHLLQTAGLLAQSQGPLLPQVAWLARQPWRPLQLQTARWERCTCCRRRDC
jgi:hypothetical protein